MLKALEQYISYTTNNLLIIQWCNIIIIYYLVHALFPLNHPGQFYLLS